VSCGASQQDALKELGNQQNNNKIKALSAYNTPFAVKLPRPINGINEYKQ
jgi:hypothetical protein